MLLFPTEADEEVFEDNPEEYIRRDMEGSGPPVLCSLIDFIVPT